jgi:hypothetical protein
MFFPEKKSLLLNYKSINISRAQKGWLVDVHDGIVRIYNVAQSDQMGI